MKIIYSLFFFIGMGTVFGQPGAYLRAVFLNPNVYQTKTDLKLLRFSKVDGSLVTPPVETTLAPAAGSTIRYKIVGTDGDYSIIQLLPIVELHTNNTITVERSIDETDATSYLYAIKTDAFGLNQKNLLSEKIVGTPLLFPYKLRLQDRGEGASLTTDFTVGYTFGLRLKMGRIPHKQNFFTIIPYGFGLGNTKYFFRKPDGQLSEKTDGVAINYYTGGLLFTINKVNFGFFAGQDAMIDKQNNWGYQGNWWYSIGLGYKFKTD